MIMHIIVVVCAVKHDDISIHSANYHNDFLDEHSRRPDNQDMITTGHQKGRYNTK